MATISPMNLPKRSAFRQKNLNWGYRALGWPLRKNRENYGKVLMHRKFLPNFIKGRKTEGRRILPE
jgi:hypothetical protein